ncbi:hypothetical protein F4677DRAFT_414862 [Hypoxylon crocopeplum]|nr:hypothetical protein F4677DRAFT_414862 [Hypoxylon crocopeplum]
MRALAAFTFLVAAVAANPTLTFDEHFATEAAAKRAPAVDLSAYGYHGGMLPRVYDVSSKNMTYSARATYDHYSDIVAGRANASSLIRKDLSSRGSKLGARTGSSVTFTTVGTNGKEDDWGTLNGDKTCKSGANAPYKHVRVYQPDSVFFITFFDGDTCDGRWASMNPTCNVDYQQNCDLIFEPKSFKVYPGCHDMYGDDGC